MSQRDFEDCDPDRSGVLVDSEDASGRNGPVASVACHCLTCLAHAHWWACPELCSG